jgi:hypothetical protein
MHSPGRSRKHKASRAAHAATSQLIDEAVGRALTTLAQLDPIIENKLAGNTALQLKWENVRRIERRWVYKKPEETSEEPKTDLGSGRVTNTGFSRRALTPRGLSKFESPFFRPDSEAK